MKPASNEMLIARTVLICDNAFFGCLALHLELVEITDPEQFGGCKTMCTDGERLAYWPPFVKRLKERERVGVVAHEVMHCALSHMTRRGHRHPYIWNIAGDFVINLELKKAGFVLPGEPVTMASPKGVKGHLYDPQYEGMSTEEVYAKIEKQFTQIELELGEGNDPGGCGGVMDAKGPQADKDKVAREWEGNTRLAVAVAKRNNPGSIPGYLQRLIDQLKQPKISYKEKTRNFIDGAMCTDYSYARPSRRHAHYDVIRPGFLPDSLHHLVMCLDVSGSIDDRTLRNYLSEVAGALDEGVADMLTVVYADTQVHRVDQYVTGETVDYHGMNWGGGTNFDATFKWIKDNAGDASCVIYLTDMMTESFGEEPNCPVLWVATLPEVMLSKVKPPFGHEIIRLDEHE